MHTSDTSSGSDEVGRWTAAGRWLATAGAWIGGGAIIAMMLLMVLEAVLLWVADISLGLVYPLVRVLLPIAIFLPLLHTARTGSHLTVDVVTSKLSPGGRTAAGWFVMVVTLGYVALVTWQALIGMLGSWAVNEQFISLISVPATPARVGILVGTASVGVYIVVRAVAYIAGKSTASSQIAEQNIRAEFQGGSR